MKDIKEIHCDRCGKTDYDAKTKTDYIGPPSLCEKYFKKYGIGLGMDKRQMLRTMILHFK